MVDLTLQPVPLRPGSRVQTAAPLQVARSGLGVDERRQAAQAGICWWAGLPGCALDQLRALTWADAAEPAGAQLGLLSGPLQAFLVPHLRLADLQRLGQACRTARALVAALPEAALLQLAQARAWQRWPAGAACRRSLSPWRVQEARLPRPKAAVRQQLDRWARQAAAVRAGNLDLDCELGNLRDLARVQLSPHADQVAACLDTTVSSDVVLAPVAGTQHALRGQLLAQPPSHTLSPPGKELLHLMWAPSGRHLVLLSSDSAAHLSTSLHVSSYSGSQLVGAFRELFLPHEGPVAVHVSDDPAIVFLFLSSPLGVRVVASTAQGIVSARHPPAWLAPASVPLEGGRVLAAAHACDKLYIYSATSFLEIGLRRAPVEDLVALLGSWGHLAVVVLCGCSDRGARELLLVDLDHHIVQHCVELPRLPGGPAVYSAAAGARGVALTLAGDQVSVLATTPRELGAELFRCPGCNAQWDATGSFLAMVRNGDGVHILDGVSGAELAYWHVYAGVVHDLDWLPDSCGFVVLAGNGRGMGLDPHRADIVKFAGRRQALNLV